MIDQKRIYKIVQSYLPTADDYLVESLTKQAEKELDLQAKNIIQKVVLRHVNHPAILGLSRIDTKA